MFEKIVLRRSENGHALSIGELAEALLFYQNVHIIFDRGILIELIKSIGFDGMLSLLSRSNVSAVYIEEMLGTSTTKYGAVQHHSFQAFYLNGHEGIAVLKGKKERLEYSLTSAGFNKKATQKFVDRFRQTVPFRSYSDNHYLPGGIINAAVEDLTDPKFIHEAIRRVLNSTTGADNVLGQFKFEVMANATGFYIFTDINLPSINEKRKVLLNETSDLSEAALINELLSARADIALAAHYGGEFYTSSLSSEIIRLRHKELLRRIGIEIEEIKQWQDIVIPESPAIKEVINSNERTFTEFLKLLDKSQKFRDWIQNVNPDEKVVKAYLADVTREGWAEKLPAKAIRYLLGNALDLSSPLLGKVFSVADNFLLDKILKGWRPSHFVENQLKPFVNHENS